MQVMTNPTLCKDVGKLHLQIYYCGYAESGSDWHADVVNPPFSRLYYILGGDGWFETAQTRRNFQPGHCYLLPGGLSFSCACSTSMRQVFFHIALLDENGRDLLPSLASALHTACDESIMQALASITNSETITTSVALRTHALLLGSIAGLFETHQITLPEKEYSPCVSRALQYIGLHVSAGLSLGEVAQNAFVSQTTLSKHFRRELGLSVRQYIENLVFAQAQLMLRGRALSIAEISEQLGFCDQFYFSRRFQRRYMESPISYRRNTFT